MPATWKNQTPKSIHPPRGRSTKKPRSVAVARYAARFIPGKHLGKSWRRRSPARIDAVPQRLKLILSKVCGFTATVGHEEAPVVWGDRGQGWENLNAGVRSQPYKITMSRRLLLWHIEHLPRMK
jgi:hypothetical protein